MPTSPVKKTDPVAITASNIAAKALATVQNQVRKEVECKYQGAPNLFLFQAFQLASLSVTPEGGISNVALAEKPVECTMCNRRFKNIPALNGHMRLHGGYYKKDAEGKRILNPKLDPALTAAGNGMVKTLVKEGSRKRKIGAPLEGASPDKLSPETVHLLQTTSQHNATATTSQPSLPFRCLPPPDTSQLLANLERKNQSVLAMHHGQSSKSSEPSRQVVTTLITPVSTTVTPTAGKVVHLPTIPFGTTASHLPLLRGSNVHSEISLVKQVQVMKVDKGVDKTPRVGAQFQADIPDDETSRISSSQDTSEMVWDPKIANRVNPQAMQAYLKLANSCLVPGGSRNEEQALEVLNQHGGNVQPALVALMAQPAARPWSDAEVNSFYEGLVKHHKDFGKIAADVGSRTVKECVAYYYWWKNLCKEESQSFKSIFAAQNNQNNDVQADLPVSSSLTVAPIPQASDNVNLAPSENSLMSMSRA